MEERLLNILKYYNLSPSSFADKLGVQRSSISHLLSGRNKPGFDFLSRVIQHFTDLNIEWFITGRGSMLKKTVAPVNLSLFDTDYMEKKQPEIKVETEDINKAINQVTNVNINEFKKQNRVSKIVLFYKDKTWEEFLPSEL